MRNFAGGAAVEKIGGDTLRVRVWSPTGEAVYHDLKPGEADAMREALGPAEPPTAESSAKRARKK